MAPLNGGLQIYLFFMAPAFWGVLAREKKESHAGSGALPIPVDRSCCFPS